VATGFGVQPTVTREGSRRVQAGERRSNALLVNGKGGVAGVFDQPFEFDPDPAGRPGLEADAVGQLLRVTLGERRAGHQCSSVAARRHQIAPSVSVVGLPRRGESTRRY
jgi:hypothetical protein